MYSNVTKLLFAMSDDLKRRRKSDTTHNNKA
jgi:hypothetical protein